MLWSSCAGPVAGFAVNEQPAFMQIVHFSNESDNADSFRWYVNDSLASKNADMETRFLSSGRHNIKLVAESEGKENSISKDVFVSQAERCHFVIRTTLGDLVVALYEETPLHLKNFVELVESGFYKDIDFHRIIQGFMVQAGETNNPRYLTRNEIPAEINKQLIHVKGALAAARMPDEMNPEKMSSATQFYIVQGRELNRDVILNYGSEKLIDYTDDQISSYLEFGGTPQLDGEYTVFGYLVSGFDVLDKIAGVSTDANDRPIEKVQILEIKEIN